ncbi:hypothetical protein [Parachitinimonas caeni]|uniref:Uncharacterized protein n=1 Tax=Parachitinimonas caeni TaxID=3031301 RepID=A0ABT7E1H8_9NEIS|nr:hypothetical protein [Parachitinimonas caeni]MDK2126104.1 hypothetical protein [Parachitinimonas caeni]
MRHWLLWMSLAGQAALAAPVCEVPLEFWDRVRSMQRVVKESGLAPCMRQLARNQQLTARLIHPPDRESQTQAEELRDWLTSTGLEGKRVVLQGQGKPGEPLRFEVVESTP